MQVAPVLRSFVQYLDIVLHSDVISGRFVGPIVPDTPVNFRYPRSGRSAEIQSEAVGLGNFEGVS